jgi:hypothetical protein
MSLLGACTERVEDGAPTCEDGVARCAGTRDIERCQGDIWVYESTCSTLCTHGACSEAVCEAQSVQCSDDGTTVQACLADGSGWVVVQACTYGCVDALCSSGAEELICNADEAFCADIRTVATCNAAGTHFSYSACTDGEVCSSGQCIVPDPICATGATRCADSATMGVCNATGTGFDYSACTQDEVCRDQACSAGPLPVISIGNASAFEPDAGINPAATFTVWLDAPSSMTVTVDYQTMNGTAVGGTGPPADYLSVAGTLTFAPGTVSQTFSVSLLDDALYEGSELFYAELSSAQGGIIATHQGLGTIFEATALPGIAVSSGTMLEGPGGADTVLRFDVLLTGSSNSEISVGYSTLNGTASAASDYDEQSGTLVFAAGESVKTVDVVIHGDFDTESDETVILSLHDVSNAVILTMQATGSIVDDDPQLYVSVQAGAVVEGDGTIVGLDVALTLNVATGAAVAVDFTTVAGTATGDVDFTVLSGTVVFAPYSVTQTISIDVLPDTLPEPMETLTIQLSNPVNAQLGTAQAGLSIVDNDIDLGQQEIFLLPALAVVESDGSAMLRFPVIVNQASASTVTVDFTLTGSAVAGDDYATPATSAVTFNPGDLQQYIDLSISPDALDEDDETVIVTLGNPTGGALIAVGHDIRTSTIFDDDAAPGIYVRNTAGDITTGMMTFTVRLDAASGKTVSVDYATADDTAVAGVDYADTLGNLSLAPGEIEKQVSVNVFNVAHGGSVHFFFNLLDPVNAGFVDNSADGTIFDVELVFSFVGDIQEVIVPPGITSATVVAFGSQASGLGGSATGTIPVAPGERLLIYVGGTPIGTVGGWNGGGDAGKPLCCSDGQGGAGASDVRQGGNTLAHRVMVGGGGGGAGGYHAANLFYGGGGGGGGGYYGGGGAGWFPNGQGDTGRGGSQIAGGAAGSRAVSGGSLGMGGEGGSTTSTNGSFGPGGAGGAGGGLSGGDGGYTASVWAGGAGGGGGSSYTSGTATSTSSGVRTGAGEVRISWMP